MTGNTQNKTNTLSDIDILPDAADAPLMASIDQAISDESGRSSRRRQTARKSAPGTWLVWIGNSFGLLWIGAAGAFLWGYLGIQSLESLSLIHI